jgi:DNA-binding MarR family transcriptional regulator
MNVETTGASQETAVAAVRLAVVVKRLRSRMREESGATSVGLSVAQLSIFSRLMNEGPATAASLAAAEHVSQQAIAQSLAGLKADGLVSVKPDPADGRKSLLSVTAAGRRLFDSIMASRDDWLIRAIEAAISPAERAALDQGIELLERLSEVDLKARRGIR